MSEQKTDLDLVTETKLMDQAVGKKWNRFTWSGLAIIAIGLILIAIGLALDTGAYSAEGLLVGLGAIVILIGIVRVLIGFINPMSPRDLRVAEANSETDQIFGTSSEDTTT